MKCKSCGAQLDFTQSACPACGTDVELGRLTGILGIVCRSCDAYNEPGAQGPAPPAARPLGAGRRGDADAGPAARARRPLPPPTARAQAARARPRSTSASNRHPPARQPLPPPAPGPPVLRCLPAGRRPRRAGDPAPSRSSRAARSRGAEASAGTFVAAAAGRRSAERRQSQVTAPVGAHARLAVPRHVRPARAPAAPRLGPGARCRQGGLGLQARRGRSPRWGAHPAAPSSSPTMRRLAPHHASFLFRNGFLHVRDDEGGGRYSPAPARAVDPAPPGDYWVVGDRLLRYAGAASPRSRAASGRDPPPGRAAPRGSGGGAGGGPRGRSRGPRLRALRTVDHHRPGRAAR